jgi:hypothetical protein
MSLGKAIPLKYKHDHIEDGVLVYSSQECSVYFLSSAESAEISLIRLQFEDACCVRSVRTEFSPAMGIYPADHEASFIVELTDSNWAVEAHEAYTYRGSTLKPRGRHFVVSNHDLLHEILAESFTETLLENGSVEYDFAKMYFT